MVESSAFVLLPKLVKILREAERRTKFRAWFNAFKSMTHFPPVLVRPRESVCRQATQGCPVNKESLHSFRGGRNLSTKVNFQVPHTPKHNQVSQLERGPLALPWPWHQYAGNPFCCASSLSGFYLTWAPVRSWPSLRSHATRVTLMRYPKECRHLIVKHLAACSLSPDGGPEVGLEGVSILCNKHLRGFPAVWKKQSENKQTNNSKF